jgi:hypothetical protein
MGSGIQKPRYRPCDARFVTLADIKQGEPFQRGKVARANLNEHKHSPVPAPIPIRFAALPVAMDRRPRPAEQGL